MAKAKQKIGLTQPTSIPLDKLVLHDGNARHVELDASISGLAADIEARGLLQSLSVRALNNEAGEETGEYGVQAGGRRLRALQLLVKQKKLAKDAPILASSGPAASSKLTALPRTSNARRCIPSTNSEPSKRSPIKARARRPSPPPSV